jgi:hypothetical protein
MQRRFNLKNLMVQIRPDLEQFQGVCWQYISGCAYVVSRWRTIGYCCGWWTDCNHHTIINCQRYFTIDPCGGLRSLCDPFSSDPCGPISPYVGAPGEDVINPEVLPVLRQHLKQALEGLDRLEQQAKELDLPQSLEEIDQEEARLRAALDELQARRQEMGSKGRRKR